jgi:hypothetical protein
MEIASHSLYQSMTNEPSLAVQTFDVSRSGGAFAKSQRDTLYLVLAAEVMLVAFGIWFGIKIYFTIVSQGFASYDTEGLSFGLGIITVLLAVLVPITSRFFSGAIEVALSDSQVVLRYPGGKSDSFGWENPRSRFSLYDYSSHPPMVRDNRAYSLLVPWGRWAMMPKECFEAILKAARERGAQITSYRGSASWYGFSPIIYLVRGSPPLTDSR